jgi:hypothetical protein
MMDPGEAEEEREVGRPLMQDGADEVGCRDLREVWNAQIQGQDRDRDDPVAERIEAGRFVPAAHRSGHLITLDGTGA